MLACLGGCAKKAEPARTTDAARPSTVVAVSYPLAYFATRMAPDGVSVDFPAPRGADPAFWRPTPEVIAQYQRAGLILLNGAGYAGWTGHASLPRSRTVVTARGCREQFLPSDETLKHQHGPEGEHAHGDTAFTTWLDFRLALCQAKNVRDALVVLRPSDEAKIDARFTTLEMELLALDEGAKAVAKAWGDRPLLASHPVYQYFADAYGLRIESLHFEPDQPLDEDALRALDDALAASPTTLMLWEGPPLASTISALEARGITAVVFDPSSNVSSDGDFLDVMQGDIRRLQCATGTAPCE
jgi:zinc transport system substrate-binding protein